MRKENKYFLVIFIIFIFSACYKFLALFPYPNTIDIGANAYQAYRIYSGKDFPIFYYGQNFMGAGGNYILALLYKIMGVSFFTISFFGFLMAVIFNLASIYTAYKMFGEKTAVFVALFWLIPTRELWKWSNKARPDYGLTFILVLVILLLTYILIEKRENKKSINFLFLLLGFCSGFAFWNNYLSSTAIFTSLLFLGFYFRKEFFLKYIFLYSAGVFIGAFPWIYANLKMNFFIFETKSIDSISSLPHKAKALIENALPFFWGIEEFEKRKSFLSYIYTGFVYLMFLMFLYSPMKRKNHIKKYSFYIIGFYIFIHIFMALITVYGKRLSKFTYPTCYIHPLYGVAFFIPSYILANEKRFYKMLASFFLIFYLFHNFYLTYPKIKMSISYILSKREDKLKKIPVKDKLFGFLTKKELDRGYVMGLIIRPVRIMYAGRIVFSDPYQQDIFDESIEVDSAKENFFWYLCNRGEPEIVLKTFKGMGINYNYDKNLKVAYNFSCHCMKRLIPPKEYNIITYPYDVYSQLLSDRNINTFWSTRRPQKKDDFIEIRLEKELKKLKLILIPYDYKTCPFSFDLSVSKDGEYWKKAKTIKNYLGPMFYSEYHPFLKIIKPRIDLFIKDEEPFKFVQLKIKKNDSHIFALREIYLLSEEAKRRGNQDEEIEKIVKYLKDLNVSLKVYANHWFSAYLKKKGFDVGFISNRSICNYYCPNPDLKINPVKFSKKTCFIINKAFLQESLRILNDYGISVNEKDFKKYSVIITEKNSVKELYWNGFSVNRIRKTVISVAKKDLMKRFDYGFLKIKSFYIDYNKKKRLISFYVDVEKKDPRKNNLWVFVHLIDNEGKFIGQADISINEELNGNAKNIFASMYEIPENYAHKTLNVVVGLWDPDEEKIYTEKYSGIKKINIFKIKL